jgi:hypothetical protein
MKNIIIIFVVILSLISIWKSMSVTETMVWFRVKYLIVGIIGIAVFVLLAL